MPQKELDLVDQMSKNRKRKKSSGVARSTSRNERVYGIYEIRQPIDNIPGDTWESVWNELELAYGL